MANGHSAELNQVSSTSGSRTSSAEPQSVQAVGVVRAIVVWPSGQYQAGIWCPHHSCRETFQGRIASSQSTATRPCTGGWKRTRPERIASAAGFASSSMRTHHCSETSGWMRVPERWQWPTAWRYDSRFSSWSCSLSQSTTRAAASSSVRPARSPASALMRPSKPITLGSGRP